MKKLYKPSLLKIQKEFVIACTKFPRSLHSVLGSSSSFDMIGKTHTSSYQPLQFKIEVKPLIGEDPYRKGVHSTQQLNNRDQPNQNYKGRVGLGWISFGLVWVHFSVLELTRFDFEFMGQNGLTRVK